MFNHVMIGANDIDASAKFYDATLGALGAGPGVRDEKGRVWWRVAGNTFGIIKPIDGGQATGANGGTIGFKAQTTEQLHAWHAAGVAAGGTPIEEPPGPRAGVPMHLAYLRDPAGNKLCAVFRPAS